MIIAHLGSGASMVASKTGKSVDTSMGFTPLEGLVMSTRSGDVDPGALLYLLANKNIAAKEMRSSSEQKIRTPGSFRDDRRTCESCWKKCGEDTAAAEAVDLFCYRVKKYIGAYAAALGGLDVLVFAGGIGEHAPAIRRRICEVWNFWAFVWNRHATKPMPRVISSAEVACRCA